MSRNRDPVTGRFTWTDDPTPEGQFWNRIPVRGDGCWLWRGAASDRGYGTLTVAGRTMRAHRFSWELHNGPIPDGLLACHKCDVPLCVNPAHLFLGTNADNRMDCIAKGRSGYSNGRMVGQTAPLRERGFRRPGRPRKLTPADVVLIRYRYAGSETQQEIATAYRVSLSTIQAIISGRSRKISA